MSGVSTIEANCLALARRAGALFAVDLGGYTERELKLTGSQLMQAVDELTGDPAGDVPLIRFGEAKRIGEALHDRWHLFAGAAPLARDDMAWGDVVQFVLREARAVAATRSTD